MASCQCTGLWVSDVLSLSGQWWGASLTMQSLPYWNGRKVWLGGGHSDGTGEKTIPIKIVVLKGFGRWSPHEPEVLGAGYGIGPLVLSGNATT